MLKKLYFLNVLLIYISHAKTEQVTYIRFLEYFDTFKILERIRDINSESSCGNHISELLNDLKSDKHWAAVMFDSSAKVPNGLFKGNIKSLGSFDECIQSKHPRNKFSGKHCLVNIYSSMNGSNGNSVFQTMKRFEETNKLYKASFLQHGICVPSTCNASEISKGFNFIFNDTSTKNVAFANLTDENCWVDHMPTPSQFNFVVITLLFIFVLIAIVSTIYDFHRQVVLKTMKPHPLLASFSIYTNGKRLFQISNDSEQLQVLHGIRVLSMFWIILHHSYRNIWLGPPANLFDYVRDYRKIDHIIILNGFIAVDTFLFLSGMLLCVVFFRDIRKKGYYDVPLAYIHRYIRLTPSYIILVLIISNIYIYLGNGPLWHSIVKRDVEVCIKNWWTGILYVQNFIEPSSTCLGISWYLSVDMQLHWLSPLILYPLYFWPSYGIFYLTIILTAAMLTNFTVANANDLGVSIFTTNNPVLQWEIDYVKFYTRASPFIIGMAAAFIINKNQIEKTKIKFKKIFVVLNWLTASGLCIVCLYGTLPFYEENFSTLKAATFLTFYRVAWGLSLSWIVFACSHDYGGPVNAILSWKMFQPISKLCYNIYLIHVFLQLYRIGKLRNNTFAENLELTYNFIGDSVISTLLAIPFTLIFEMPFGNIDKYFFCNVKIFPIPRQKDSGKNENTSDANNEVEQGNVNLAFKIS